MTAFSEVLGEGGKDPDLAVRVTDLEARVAALEAASPPPGSGTPPHPAPATAAAELELPAPALGLPAAALELPPVGALLTSSAIARATGTNPSGWSAWAANHATGSIRQYGGASFRLVVRSDRGRRRISWERLA
jgi:hypothetical protein